MSSSLAAPAVDDVNDSLLLAAINDDDCFVQLLLRAGADVDYERQRMAQRRSIWRLKRATFEQCEC
jgi:hypothetical protein